MNQLEKKLSHIFLSNRQAIEPATEGFKLSVHLKGKPLAEIQFGRTYKYYDLASLTKILFTTTSVIRAEQSQKLTLRKHVNSFLPEFPINSTSIKSLLNHTAGLPAWSAFYKKINLSLSDEEKWQQLYQMLAKAQKRKDQNAVYSDLDFLYLGFLLEEVFEDSLINIWKQQVASNLKGQLHFCEGNQPKYLRKLYAPTEKCPWRNKVLRGEVHDDNTWALGGVAPHAGLFGKIEDVTEWGLLLRKAWLQNRNNKLFQSSVVQKYGQRSIPRRRGDWATGFMMPTKGHASCGQGMSSRSIGHTGFTGTSFWLDPKRDLMIVILSNRVHPTRNNKNFVKLRPWIHDQVICCL